MADISYDRSGVGTQAGNDDSRRGFGHMIVKMFKRYQLNRQYVRSAMELRSLDDNLLEDIGVSRSEIEYRVRHGR